MTCTAAVVRRNDFGKLLLRHLAFAYLEECAYYGANHIAQEPICCDDKPPFRLALLSPFGFLDVADSRLGVRVRAAEGSKILFADHPCCRSVHCLKIQPCCHTCVVDIEEWIFSRCDPVMVGSFDGIEACVCVLFDGLQVSELSAVLYAVG